MTHHSDRLNSVITKPNEYDQLYDQLHNPDFEQLRDLRKRGLNPAKSQDPKILAIHKHYRRVLNKAAQLITNLPVVRALEKYPELHQELLLWLFVKINQEHTSNIEKFRADEFPDLPIAEALQCYLQNKIKYLKKDEHKKKNFEEVSIDAPNSFGQSLINQGSFNAGIEQQSWQNNSIDGLGNQEFFDNLCRGIIDRQRFDKFFQQPGRKQKFSYELFRCLVIDMVLNKQDDEQVIFARVSQNFNGEWTASQLRHAWKYGRSGNNSMEYLLRQISLELAQEHCYTADPQKSKTKKPKGEKSSAGDDTWPEGVA